MTPLVYMRSRHVRVTMYTAEDGLMSFAAVYVSEHPLAGQLSDALPTFEECGKIVPFGWELFTDGNSIRARPMHKPP